MKHPSVIVALIIGVSLTISTWLLSSAIKDYGRSMERAKNQPRPVEIPSEFTVSFEGGNTPLRIESRN